MLAVRLNETMIDIGNFKSNQGTGKDQRIPQLSFMNIISYSLNEFNVIRDENLFWQSSV